MLRRLVVPALVLLCGSGCSFATDESARKLADMIVANHLGELSWAIAWRSLLGGALGLALGVALFFGIRQLNGFRWNWEHARWARALTGTAYGVTFAGALAWFGFWQGIMHGTERVVGEGQLATEVLPVVGEAGSTLLAVVYVGGELTCEQDTPISDEDAAMLAARLDGWVAGEWQMDVETLRGRIDGVRTCVITLGTDEAKRQIAERYPEVAATLGHDIVPWVIDRLAEHMAASLAENEKVADFTGPIVDMLARLDEAAVRDDDPRLSHRELSDHVVTATVVPMIMMPVEHVVDGQKLAGVFAALILVALSIGLFQLAHHQYERRRTPPVATPNSGP
jgi:hypothetical protein